MASRTVAFIISLLKACNFAQGYEICQDTTFPLTCYDTEESVRYCCKDSLDQPKCCDRLKSNTSSGVFVFYVVIGVAAFVLIFCRCVDMCIKRYGSTDENESDGPRRPFSRNGNSQSCRQVEDRIERTDVNNDRPPSYSEVTGEGRSEEYQELLKNYIYNCPDYQTNIQATVPPGSSHDG